MKIELTYGSMKIVTEGKADEAYLTQTFGLAPHGGEGGAHDYFPFARNHGMKAQVGKADSYNDQPWSIDIVPITDHSGQSCVFKGQVVVWREHLEEAAGE